MTPRWTTGFGNPDILESLMGSRLWPAADLSGVRFLITGGAPVPEPLIRAYLERGLTLLQGYGLSEAAPVALLLQPDSALAKVGSAGTPPLFVDTKIVGPAGAGVGPFQAGELLIRGPNVMAGYWNRPEDTAAALTPDGWLRTGDAARSDEDGYIWIIGRAADSFISCGQGTADSTQTARPVPERRGTGLGLDIVRRTAARAGGNAAVGRTPGGGFRVEVQVPDNAARPSASASGFGD